MADGRSSTSLYQWLSVGLGAGGLVASMAYYFGWVYLQEQYFEYGSTPEIVGYSRPDVIFRSVNVFIPSLSRWLVGALVIGAVYLLIDRAVVFVLFETRLGPKPRPAASPRTVSLGMLGLVMMVAAGLLASAPTFGRVGRSAEIERWYFLGVLAVVVALIAIKHRPVSWRTPANDALVGGARVSMVVLLVFGLAAVVRHTATDEGRRTACAIELNPERYGLASFSVARDLGLSPSGTDEDRQGAGSAARPEDGSGQPDRYDYDGYRVLTRIGDTYWMWPVSSSPRNGLVGVPTAEILSIAVVRTTTEDRDGTFTGQAPLCRCLLANDCSEFLDRS